MKKDKKSKKKVNGTPIGAMLICMLMGAICGIVMVTALDGALAWAGGAGALIIEITFFLIAYLLQTVIHEAGHLVAGIISGYEFGSFRVGSVMFLKENGRIKVKKHSVAGTAGQCLMIPPTPVDGKFPVIFYNLGGALMNLVFTVIPIILAIIFSSVSLLYAFLVMMALAGFLSAVTNGIPLKLGMVNNDGSNARELYKNEEAMRVFHNQFMTVAALGEGKGLADMPQEWFFMPSEAGLVNSITVSGAVFRENWLVAQGRYDEALELIEYLLSADTALVGLHKSLLNCDKITILLASGGSDEQVRQILGDKELEAFFKQMKNNISVVRTQYAAALLLDNDENKAKALREHFEKCAKEHPYPSEISTERELMLMVEARSKSGKIE